MVHPSISVNSEYLILDLLRSANLDLGTGCRPASRTHLEPGIQDRRRAEPAR